MTSNPVKPAAASMSLGGGASSVLDDVVARSIAAGITYVIAADNNATDACTSSPARAPAAATVGATGSAEAVPSFSSYRSCLDIFAPGVNVSSALPTSDTAAATTSGTSTASPYVTGADVLILSANTGYTPARIRGAFADLVHPSTSCVAMAILARPADTGTRDHAGRGTARISGRMLRVAVAERSGCQPLGTPGALLRRSPVSAEPVTRRPDVRARLYP